MASQVNVSGKNIALDAIGNACGWMALYTDVAGTIEVSGGTYARQAITWAAAANGVKQISNQPVFPIPAGTTVRAIGITTASSGGTQHAIDDVTAESYGGNGTYRVDGFQITL